MDGEKDRSFVQPEEGFRGVRWCTRRGDIAWTWSAEGFGAPCALRADEDLDVCGLAADEVTYTFRNSLLYGVRIDFSGKDQVAPAVEVLKKTYPPSEPMARLGPRIWRWCTGDTWVWVEAPGRDGAGKICLWGRHRMFADDVDRPLHLALPPGRNSFPGRYAPRRYVCYRASGPITIDGRLDEKAWRDAPWTDFFHDHQAPYAPGPWKSTRAKILYDDDHLYFAAQLQEENVWGSLVERDCVIYYDNDFEIFLDPTADGVGYYEFEINPLNTLWDMFHETDYHRASALHTLYDIEGVEHAIDVQGTLNWHGDRDIGWTVEVKWPLQALLTQNPRVSLPIKRGDTWRVNFSRVQYLHLYDRLYPTKIPDTPCEDWIWQSTETGDLHNPEMWGKVVFSDLPAASIADEGLERALPQKRMPARSRLGGDEMVFLPACSCSIGPDPTDALRSPGHAVEVGDFWMDRYPVTVAEYAAFLNLGGNDEHYSTWMRLPERCGIVPLGAGQYGVVPGREDFPVVYVSYEGALAYAESVGKELPTEFEWERAARGPEGRTYAWGEEGLDPSRANYDFHYGGTTPVGALVKGASPEGIFDLTGNVKEYTTSWFESYPGGGEMVYLGMREPFVYDEPRKFRVVRGGAWTKQAGCMAAAYRDAHGSLNMGFRCIRRD
ncbi:MAG: SUMF1/EgtB/PvdO family nonheme iron enzyme [Candidatus Latescibacteria bacterium]|nr:SUMF1/EgtB/PvdO family nonheme iron enzyme [Candidatus Latescibacterota bacterium]